jgi:hypothetical protein
VGPGIAGVEPLKPLKPLGSLRPLRSSMVRGAMSGAYAPHPGHTRAPLRCRRHEEQ